MKYIFALLSLLTHILVEGRPSPTSRPVVKLINGSYVGVHSPEYNQDYFLGIPYAQQPVGNLRFRVPKSLNETWRGEREANAYTPFCVGYGSASIWYNVSEACLNLNVVRPSTVNGDIEKLPVAVWIHGGGFIQGSGNDQRYNLSFIVENAEKIGKPFIGVSISYRLAAWGFLSSQEVSGSGNTNLGLRDQRLALHWVKENIAAFGGDPSKITIWGQSAGAFSVGAQLIAYGGRDDSLFRAAILESGSSIGLSPPNSTAMNQAWYDTIVANVSCADTLDTLQCLREVPFESLNAAVNVTSTGTYGFVPSIDGDFLRNWGSLQLSKGQFVKVPIIMGTNTDEGTFFSPNGINNDQQLYDFLTAGAAGYNLTSSMADKIQSLYPNVPRDGIPAYLGNETVQSKGLEWRRVSTYAGDFLMHASRRKQCKAWAAFGVTAYCYRFNVHSSQAPYIMGATHFEEVAFVFNNLEGVGYHYGKPFTGTPPSYSQLSYLMSSMWASFIHESNPNTGGTAPKWPVYKRREAEDFVFDANITSYIENDTWRGEAIDFINSLSTYLQR